MIIKVIFSYPNRGLNMPAKTKILAQIRMRKSTHRGVAARIIFSYSDREESIAGTEMIQYTGSFCRPR